MLRIMMVACGLLALTLAVEVRAEEAKEAKLMCPVAGRPAKTDFAVDYKGGKVYFCCPNCPGAFKKNPEKFASKANHQLVASGQAKQVGCPFSGGKVNPATVITVKGAKIGFCCNNCKGKATQAEGAAQVTLLFGDKAFDKAFKVEK